MLEDVAVRALSPGVNDPNTAASVIPLLGEAVLEILCRDLPPGSSTLEGCRIEQPGEPSYADYVGTAFDQIRLAARDQPHVIQVLDRTAATIVAELARRGIDGREERAAAVEALRRELQGEL